MNSSRIAVIVRAFQRYKNLPVLIHSFLAQTDPRWTLYVVHDGPDEPHAALMQPYLPLSFHRLCRCNLCCLSALYRLR